MTARSCAVRAGLLFWLSGALGAPGSALTLARDGRAEATVVVAMDATPAERTAAQELATYLGRVTGARFANRVAAEDAASGRSIHVGPTALARRHGCLAAELGDEEWIIRTVGDELILCGGRPRGTLYAVYHFLEDHVGVRWWTPYEESVPRRRRLVLPALAGRGRPGFVYRDISGIEGPPEFYARNRMNGHLAELPWAWGGTVGYGPPSQCHNFAEYVPPSRHFAAHPEYFSEIDGIRRVRAQLCLTNPGLFELVAAKLEAYIEAARSAAEQKGEPPPRLFAFSQNDWGGACQCAACRAVDEHEGSSSGTLVQFLGRLAERVRAKHPEVLLDTLAYHYTFRPPRTLRLPGNVVVRVAALQYHDFSKPVSDAVHREYQEALAGWRGVTEHLRIWDYIVTFGRGGDLPLPNLRWVADDYRSYVEHGVEGLFVQHDYPISADLRDLKLWVLLKLLENPRQRYDELLGDFTDGYYGPAGGLVRRYLKELEEAARRHPAAIGYPRSPSDYAYLDGPFLVRADALWTRAEQRVADDPVLRRRVRHARLSLDRAILSRGREVWGRGVDWPLDPWQVARRYRATWHEQVRLRSPRVEGAEFLVEVDREIAGVLRRLESRAGYAGPRS